ncbi:type V CRISPR-associated protein Cas12a/Cpf1, partial [Candidatus Dependentiae bacterium]|nr:type V CRISPR-associated protein Cas12a/Cpf1 [Candidatus Dependentiae bacterium]
MKKLKTKGKYFSDFTNLYELSKTLCFELKPVKNTQAMLEENKVFERDKTRKEKYEKVKPYFDRLHREFVKESLQDAHLKNLTQYFDLYKKWQKDKKDIKMTKELNNVEKKLREQIMLFFNEKAKEYANKKPYLKKKDIGIFFEEAVFQLLKERYGSEPETIIPDEATGEEVCIFDEWKNFTGYFSKFHETRKNFYKTDGTSTAIATRAIDQNLKRFCGNWLIFEKIKNKIDISEVEKNFNVSLENALSPKNYSDYLLQNGIDKYNEILGGKTEKNGNKLRGINELINEYRQNNKGEKLPYLKPLDKQILGEKESFISENEIDENNILKKLEEFKNNAKKKIEALNKLICDFSKNENFELDKIYISKEAFNTIAHKWTNETQKLEEFLYGAMKADKPTGLKHDTKENTYKFPDFIALQYIKTALENIMDEEKVKFWKERYYENKDEASNNGFLTDEENIWDQFVQILQFEFKSNYDNFNNSKLNLEEYLKKNHFENKKKDKIVIKEFADATLWTYQVGKYFALEKKRKWIGDEYDLCSTFYENPDFGFRVHFYENAYDEIVKIYNELRNFLTKKPWEDVQKWKLNFENPTLANGWDKNKEPDNTAILFKKDEKYFLGIMKKGFNKLFDDRNLAKFNGNNKKGFYQKVVYKYFPDQAKMFPKVCFSKKGLDFFQPSEEIYNIYKNVEFKKGDSFNLKSMHKLIDFYKDCLKKYEGWHCYEFKNLKSTREYKENIGEFFSDVAKDGYKISFQEISEEYINKKNKNGELYLFQIKNKDWNEGATGKSNLHTLYFENIFSDQNINNDFIIKLNGQAELFFRPKAIEAKKVKRNFKREIIEKKRYTQDKIFFHCPITMNRGKGDIYQFNNKINKFLANNPYINLIGVDRGEKHLAYYSVINQKQEILDSGSLNFVGKGTDGKPVDYYEK